jgi:wyosine [tRNA(Phe)-imidazoG37] synthetase (radical SAM superfamily)
MIVFGPVPSRRLGRSVGINNIPPKVCSYACIYCQLGKTTKMQIKRQTFYNMEDITKEVKKKIKELNNSGEKIDYLTFVSDGEPTLDINMGKEINVLKPLGFKIAVITNASLIWQEDVRRDLLNADWVSLKIDAVTDEVWHRINRPFFNQMGINSEYLIGYEGNEFSSTGNIEEDLLNITAVHPMKKQAVEELLRRNNCDWDVIDRLISGQKIIMSEYRGEIFYMRRLSEEIYGLM